MKEMQEKNKITWLCEEEFVTAVKMVELQRNSFVIFEFFQKKIENV